MQVFSTGFFNKNNYGLKPFFDSNLARFQIMLDLFCFDFGAKILMPRKRKKMMISDGAETPKVDLAQQIKNVAAGLWYISETDAEILAFTGNKADSVTKENLLNQIGKPSETSVEERDFIEFFTRLTQIRDWFGDEEKATAEKFAALKNLLENNLKDLKVFKVGQIQLDVYVIGLDIVGNLSGIQTKAVET